jgi:hypothetical protein
MSNRFSIKNFFGKKTNPNKTKKSLFKRWFGKKTPSPPHDFANIYQGQIDEIKGQFKDAKDTLQITRDKKLNGALNKEQKEKIKKEARELRDSAKKLEKSFLGDLRKEKDKIKEQTRENKKLDTRTKRVVFAANVLENHRKLGGRRRRTHRRRA